MKKYKPVSEDIFYQDDEVAVYVKGQDGAGNMLKELNLVDIGITVLESDESMFYGVFKHKSDAERIIDNYINRLNKIKEEL